MTEDLLRKMMPNAGSRLDAHLPYINEAMERGGISTPDRIAAFLAQLAHESAEYRYMAELADGSAYEGRTDLGNTQPGDGVKYKGHGPIQITGRDNHRAAGIYLGIDAEATPTLLTRPEYGTASAVWFWTIGNKKVDLNLLADRGWFKTITRIINGGYNGLSDRRLYWDRNRALLGLPPINLDLEAASIAAFQAANGLAPDGVAGPKTFAALKAASQKGTYT